jgi:thiamine-monophosphate kinase
MKSEFDLIAALVERLPPPGEGVRVGSGDDAAVTEPHQGASVTTVDAIVDGVHFTLPEFGPRAVGRKALAASLSDLAAMGAEPGEAYVALGVPEEMGSDDLLELADGLADVAEREGAWVVGGDVTRAPALSLAVTCVGHEPAGGRLVTRSGARPGDALVVTGALGGAAAALRLLEGDDAPGLDPELRAGILGRQLDARPRLAAGRALAGAGATAMIDVSDGLGADAGHVARASGVRIEIEAARVPLAAGLRELAEAVTGDELAWALSGGEDFELLAALPAGAEEGARGAMPEGLELTVIGTVLPGEGVLVQAEDGSEIEAGGFDHMRGSRAGSSGGGSSSRPSSSSS